jgi:hypothetical protein
MAISNELSSDIAAALIAANAKQPDQLPELKQILIEVHSTLQRMTEQSRSARSCFLTTRDKNQRNQ